MLFALPAIFYSLLENEKAPAADRRREYKYRGCGAADAVVLLPVPRWTGAVYSGIAVDPLPSYLQDPCQMVFKGKIVFTRPGTLHCSAPCTLMAHRFDA
jgi:hypothetical protein